MKKRNKKGLIFALDGAIAVTVVVLMVINSVYYFSVASRSSLSHLQATKIAEDIIVMHDRIGSFDAIAINNTHGPFTNGFNITKQQLNFSRFLPGNYEMWASVSDLKETLVYTLPCTGSNPTQTSPSYDSLPLEKNMSTYLQLNITALSNLDGVLQYIKIFQSQVVTNYYFKGSTSGTNSSIHTFGPFPFGSGINKIFFDIDGGCVVWYRILGTEAYAGSTNETLVYRDAFPKDRFIGTGQHLFTTKKLGLLIPGENRVEGTHLVRYKIWLKGGT